MTDRDQASPADRHSETARVLTDECTVMVQELIAFVIKERNDLTEEINRVYSKAIADLRAEMASLRLEIAKLNSDRAEPEMKQS